MMNIPGVHIITCGDRFRAVSPQGQVYLGPYTDDALLALGRLLYGVTFASPKALDVRDRVAGTAAWFAKQSPQP